MSGKYQLYGVECSLYSGKARSYLRKKGIPFDEVLATINVYKKFIIPRTGVQFIPVVQSPEDDVWQDTTEIIDQLESRFPEHPVYPSTPKQRLVSLLLETYADEWLVIPAMHYRWNYPATNGRFIYGEFGSIVMPSAPGFIRRYLGKKAGARFKGAVPKLGVKAHNINAIEKSYVSLLGDLQTHFEQYDFVLGGKPSLADFGLIGPLYAHLYRDPAPGKLMRKKAPALCDWVRRMISDEVSMEAGEWLANDEIPETLMPVLQRMSHEQLPVIEDTDRLLAEWRTQNPDEATIDRMIGTHEFSIEGVTAERAVLPYVLWMYQRAVDDYHALSDTAAVDALLQEAGFGDALRRGLTHRVTRENNRLQFAAKS